mmetsp:Transcript_7793/g.24390  ORF Transcript_7793/g.24390 Transcript_7793/m.24390 type:complete len:331 (-) Transcript_7793:254-1246(-)
MPDQPLEHVHLPQHRLLPSPLRLAAFLAAATAHLHRQPRGARRTRAAPLGRLQRRPRLRLHHHPEGALAELAAQLQHRRRLLLELPACRRRRHVRCRSPLSAVEQIASRRLQGEIVSRSLSEIAFRWSRKRAAACRCAHLLQLRPLAAGAAPTPGRNTSASVRDSNQCASRAPQSTTPSSPRSASAAAASEREAESEERNSVASQSKMTGEEAYTSPATTPSKAPSRVPQRIALPRSPSANATRVQYLLCLACAVEAYCIVAGVLSTSANALRPREAPNGAIAICLSSRGSYKLSARTISSGAGPSNAVRAARTELARLRQTPPTVPMVR